MVAWRRLDEFDRERAFGKWLRGIARNLILAHFRKSGKNPLSMDVSTLDWMDEKFTQIQSRTGDTLSDKLSLLRDCVEALTQENRDTIKARYLEQSSLDEIVSKLDVARETVKKRLYRAKNQLAECLENKLLALEEV